MKKRGRPRTYRHDIRCPECGSNWIVKNGKQKDKQTYLCRDCSRRFTPDAERIHHPKYKKRQSISMFCEGMSISALSRVLSVKYSTVYSWIYRMGQIAKELVDKKIEKLEEITFEKISFDEMWTYEKVRRGEKRQEVWIWSVVLEDENKRLRKMMFVGDRDSESFLKNNGKNARK